MQDVNYASAANARRIVHPGLREVRMIAKLLRALAGEVQHVFLAAEVEAARWTRFNARWFQPFAHAIGAQRALEDAIVLRVHFRNIERTSRDAVAATDAIGLLEIHDAIGVLDDGAVRGAGREAARLRAVHALVLAHEPHEGTIFLANVFVEEDQVPVIPARLRHGLVTVAENRFAKRQIVPLHAGHFARFAADASGCVNEFADGVFPLRILAGYASGVPGDFLNA